jgi:hypothetical protein
VFPSAKRRMLTSALRTSFVFFFPFFPPIWGCCLL